MASRAAVVGHLYCPYPMQSDAATDPGAFASPRRQRRMSGTQWSDQRRQAAKGAANVPGAASEGWPIRCPRSRAREAARSDQGADQSTNYPLIY